MGVFLTTTSMPRWWRLSSPLSQGSAGGVKRDVSGSLSRGINAKRLCTRLKKKDGQMCELRYDKKFDPKTVRAF